MVAEHSTYEEAVVQVMGFLREVNFQVIRTFDLQSACAKHQNGLTHHDTAPSDPQMTVLMVYGQDSDPVTLKVQGAEGHIWLSLVDTPQQSVDPVLEADIIRVVIAQGYDIER
jgi:hypothetical protein